MIQAIQYPTSCIYRIDQIPVPDLTRKRTDNFCTLFGVLFTLVIFGYSVAVFKAEDHMQRVVFPSDGDGGVCGYEYSAYPYLYFSDLNDITKRLCVKKCPSLNDRKLQCMPNSRESCFRKQALLPTTQRLYDTEPAESRMGFFCFPKDPIVRRQLLLKTQLFERANFIQAYDTICICIVAAVVLGITYMMLVQICPTVLNYVAILFGGISSIAFGVLLILNTSPEVVHHPQLTLAIAISAIVLGVILLIAGIMNRRYLRVCGVFLRYATRFVVDRPSTLLYIPLFLLMALGLLVLVVFEFIAVWSAQSPVFDRELVFHVSRGNTAYIFSALIIIQLLWGLSFLRQLFNYIVSGNASSWFFGVPGQCFLPMARVLRFHFGSVVAAGFMTGFFGPIDFLFSVVKPDDYTTGYGQCYYPLCGWLTSLFELVRSDALSYVNLTGLPYCVSSRYCEFLCNITRLYKGNQPAAKLYRIGAITFLTMSVAILGLVYNSFAVSIFALLFILFFSVYIVTYFVDIYADAADSLAITFMAEEYLVLGDFQQMKRAPVQLINQVLVASGIAYQP